MKVTLEKSLANKISYKRKPTLLIQQKRSLTNRLMVLSSVEAPSTSVMALATMLVVAQEFSTFPFPFLLANEILFPKSTNIILAGVSLAQIALD